MLKYIFTLMNYKDCFGKVDVHLANTYFGSAW